MLSIGKLGASRKQLEYYEHQVAAGIEDYYTGRGEAPGRWCGAGIEALGPTCGSQVDRGAFKALMHGRDPGDGTVLRPMSTCSTVAALDLTFSAPKSVSVLFAIADGQTSSALLEAHERAVAEALAYLEREACWTRRGHGGAERLRGEGFIAASYRHRISRAGDPQLHTHVVVANMARARGRYTSLGAHSLYEHKSAAGAVYRAVLRAEIRDRLPWVSWHGVGRGLFEIDGIPDAVLRHFSQRRVEIEGRAAEIAAVEAGGLSRERMQGIALQTRRAKEYGVDGSTWREQARARAAEHGFGHSELAGLHNHSPVSRERPDLEQLFARLSGPEGLTSMHNTFARRHALAEIAGAFPQGASATDLHQATAAYLDSPSVLELGPQGDPQYTSIDLLAREHQIIESTDRRTHEQLGVIWQPLVDRVLARYQPALNADQAAVVRGIASRGRGIEAVEALAGTGKTTLIGALAACYQQTGWRVLGAAPTGRAARQLRDVAQIPAVTMHALLGELDRAGGFAPRTVLVVDEAGMAPTRLTAALFAHAERAGTKVVAVGDPGQLDSVQAGGWLAAIGRRQPGPALRQVVRQRDRQEQAALEALHDGDPERYLAHKRDAITVHGTEAAALEALVEEWHDARREHGAAKAVMIARDNRTRDLLNQAAREHLRRDRVLPARETLIGQRWFAAGDRVITRRNDRHLDVDNGTLATVIGVDAGGMELQTDSGDRRRIECDYVAQHVEHAYALTAHGAQGATVMWAAVIGRPEEFTREWAYTALSRARERTVPHLIAERSEGGRHGDHYSAQLADRSEAEVLRALHRAMKRSEAEPLALERVRTESGHARQRDDAKAARDAARPDLAALDLQRMLAHPRPPPYRAPQTRWRELRRPERGIHCRM
jgi:conjugative relaxase-like TrwC/TraI family protein